jgi:acetyltransferase-like isoleucine patch superfamily enzyme
MGNVTRFARKYRGRLVRLAAEEVLGALVRGWPSLPGMWARAALWKPLFRRLDGMPLIYPGVYVTHAYGIAAGRRLSVNTGALIDGRGGITIGDDVMIGPYAVVTSSTHNHARRDVPMTALDHEMQPLTIGSDVWIGAHAFIRGGVTLGNGCVIGAGSVVLTDVPPFSIAAGVPARVVGARPGVSEPARA